MNINNTADLIQIFNVTGKDVVGPLKNEIFNSEAIKKLFYIKNQNYHVHNRITSLQEKYIVLKNILNGQQDNHSTKYSLEKYIQNKKIEKVELENKLIGLQEILDEMLKEEDILVPHRILEAHLDGSTNKKKIEYNDLPYHPAFPKIEKWGGELKVLKDNPEEGIYKAEFRFLPKKEVKFSKTKLGGVIGGVGASFISTVLISSVVPVHIAFVAGGLIGGMVGRGLVGKAVGSENKEVAQDSINQVLFLKAIFCVKKSEINKESKKSVQKEISILKQEIEKSGK